METKILVPEALCKMDAVKYVAFRYDTTPEKIMKHFMVQTGIVKSGKETTDNYELAPNEIALLSDLGLQPSIIEIQ